MIAATGSCPGIENYSRYLTGRRPGEPPPTLFEYIPDNALLIVDESHISVPQLGGMFRGDFQRKSTLAEFGFRLPSCVDNRPLKFEEWELMRPQTVFVSATPGPWELRQTGGVFVEQVIRPTGLIDPMCIVRPVENQVDDLMAECRGGAARGLRVLVTTLTKRMAEDLTEYLHEKGVRVRYMHSDIDTLERIEIVRDLRLGAFDVLVGINLLREGLDIPECMLVAILDADKEGYLRSKTSLFNPALERYDHVLLDLDGCLWVGDEALPDAPAAVTLLRERGKGIGFLTNDARHAPEDFVRRLWRLGFQAAASEVVTCGAALQFTLASRGGDAGATAYVVGAAALVDHVAEAGLRIVNNTEFATRADIVVVAAHDRFDYRELRTATQAVLRGAELVGVTRDRTFPMPDGPWPHRGRCSPRSRRPRA